MDSETRALYVISVAAELAGVHPQTLRIYERKGLIEPQRTEGRSRRYSPRDIEMLQRIQELTNEGLSLTGVKHVLDLERRLAEAHQEILQLRSDIERARQETLDAVRTVHRQYRRDLVPVSKTVVHVQRVR